MKARAIRYSKGGERCWEVSIFADDNTIVVGERRMAAFVESVLRQSTSRECPACGGGGIEPYRNECRSCGGTGLNTPEPLLTLPVPAVPATPGRDGEEGETR